MHLPPANVIPVAGRNTYSPPDAPPLVGRTLDPDGCLIQKATNDLDRDETYIPPLRSALPFAVAGAHALEETPAATLFKLCIRQFLCVVIRKTQH